MILRRELCDLKDANEGNVCLKIAGESLRNSEWTLVGGLPSAHYFDLDNYICNKQDAKALVQLLADKVTDLSKQYEFEKVALIDKGGTGPVGLIALFSAFSLAIDKEVVIVRSQKQLVRSTVKGNLNEGDNVLVLNDVATMGWTIFEAAQRILTWGAKVPYALVVVDRCQGATTNLGRKGIELFSLFSAKTMLEQKEQELKSQYGRTIFPDFKTQLVDFGGSSATIMG